MKYHIEDCFKINDKQKIIIPKKCEYVKFKNCEKQLNLLIYAVFENIFVPEVNEKQNLYDSCTNKSQKHIPCSYGYKLVCADDKFSKPFKTYLGNDAVYNFIK